MPRPRGPPSATPTWSGCGSRTCCGGPPTGPATRSGRTPPTCCWPAAREPTRGWPPPGFPSRPCSRCPPRCRCARRQPPAACRRSTATCRRRRRCRCWWAPTCSPRSSPRCSPRAADRLALSVEGRRVAELTRRHRDQLGFLAEASDLLAGTLDPQMTLAMLAQLLVPRLAVWCALWVQGARGMATLSYVWHADEGRLDSVRAALDDLLAASADPAGPARAAAEPFPVDVRELGPDPAVALPLRARGRTLGVAMLGRGGGDRIEPGDLDLAAELSRRAALALDNALLYRTQLATSRALQQSLLPAALPAVPGLEVGVAYRAAGEGLDAGGDFYDLFAVDEGRWRFAVGDVSGNGPEAAAVTGLARHALRLLARLDRPLADAVAQLNQAILDQEGRTRFLTVLHGEISLRPAGGILVVVVAAGHPLPYLVEPSGRVRVVGTPGPLLGVLDRVEHRTEAIHLAPGETLVCVTDGVLERRNAGRTLGEDDLGPLLARRAVEGDG